MLQYLKLKVSWQVTQTLSVKVLSAIMSSKWSRADTGTKLCQDISGLFKGLLQQNGIKHLTLPFIKWPSRASHPDWRKWVVFGNKNFYSSVTRQLLLAKLFIRDIPGCPSWISSTIFAWSCDSNSTLASQRRQPSSMLNSPFLWKYGFICLSSMNSGQPCSTALRTLASVESLSVSGLNMSSSHQLGSIQSFHK